MMSGTLFSMKVICHILICKFRGVKSVPFLEGRNSFGGFMRCCGKKNECKYGKIVFFFGDVTNFNPLQHHLVWASWSNSSTLKSTVVTPCVQQGRISLEENLLVNVLKTALKQIMYLGCSIDLLIILKIISQRKNQKQIL